MTLPDQMTNRWARRRDPEPGEQTLYRHVLMRDYPDVGDLAQQARHQLAAFDGLHMTPPDCLHMTTLVAGPADQFSDNQLHQMLSIAKQQLANIRPISVSLGKIIYHPEAILFAVTPGDALTPLRRAARTATRAAGHAPSDETEQWRPHVTLCYSTSEQPAKPIISALGMHLPERTITVRSLSLVIQNGSELL
ncbi:MAG: 2'-5' RNA ligase family protein [Streptosporangiaceae bacterium]